MSSLVPPNTILLPAKDRSANSTKLRSYQLECVHACLRHNTLVVLPTGLGKTLIAACVLHNFNLKYSDAKLVFVAPTRPLVNQQWQACQNSVGISADLMGCITGHDNVDSRRQIWQTKKIFFLTPQILKNDCCSGLVDGASIKCLIQDVRFGKQRKYFSLPRKSL